MTDDASGGSDAPRASDHRRTPTPTRRQFLGAGTALFGAGLAGCVITAEPVSETLPVSYDPGDADALAVETSSGDMTLTSL